jgi:hypothetical protein
MSAVADLMVCYIVVICSISAKNPCTLQGADPAESLKFEVVDPGYEILRLKSGHEFSLFCRQAIFSLFRRQAMECESRELASYPTKKQVADASDKHFLILPDRMVESKQRLQRNIASLQAKVPWLRWDNLGPLRKLYFWVSTNSLGSM